MLFKIRSLKYDHLLIQREESWRDLHLVQPRGGHPCLIRQLSDLTVIQIHTWAAGKIANREAEVCEFGHGEDISHCCNFRWRSAETNGLKWADSVRRPRLEAVVRKAQDTTGGERR